MSSTKSNGAAQIGREAEDEPAELDREASIALLAYEKWQARGCPVGDDRRDWFEAEKEILAARASEATPAAKPNLKQRVTS